MCDLLLIPVFGFCLYHVVEEDFQRWTHGCNVSQTKGERDICKHTVYTHSVHTHTQCTHTHTQTSLLSATMKSRRYYQRNDSPADLQRSPVISIHLSFLPPSASQPLNSSVTSDVSLFLCLTIYPIFFLSPLSSTRHSQCDSFLHLGKVYFSIRSRRMTLILLPMMAHSEEGYNEKNWYRFSGSLYATSYCTSLLQPVPRSSVVSVCHSFKLLFSLLFSSPSFTCKPPTNAVSLF